MLKQLSIAFCVVDLVTMLISKSTQSQITSLLSYPETLFLYLYPHFHLLGSQIIILSISYNYVFALSPASPAQLC